MGQARVEMVEDACKGYAISRNAEVKIGLERKVEWVETLRETGDLMIDNE